MMETLTGSALELRQGQTFRLQSWLELTSTGLAMLEECSPLCWARLLLSSTFSTFSAPVGLGARNP